jgi:hypothetical protein
MVLMGVRNFLLDHGVIKPNMDDVNRALIMLHLSDKGVPSNVLDMMKEITGEGRVRFICDDAYDSVDGNGKFKVIVRRERGIFYLDYAYRINDYDYSKYNWYYAENMGDNFHYSGSIPCEFCKNNLRNINEGIGFIFRELVPKKWKELTGREAEKENKILVEEDCINKLWTYCKK